jgi:hypothetical protein
MHSTFGVAGLAGMIFDIRGVLYGTGRQGRALADAPYAGIGFVEAHGLAVILPVLLWRAKPDRSGHFTGVPLSHCRALPTWRSGRSSSPRMP